MGGKGGSEMVLIPVRLTTDDYMDVGGRATHGAVAEGPEGLADAGCLFLLLLWARKEEEIMLLF